jgi:hypothetical protein
MKILEIGLVVLIFIIVSYSVWKNKELSSKQRVVKALLNLLLLSAVLLIILDPGWAVSKEKILIYDGKVPGSWVKKLEDSLGVDRSLSLRQYLNNPFQDGKIYLLGQSASPELLSSLAGSDVHWIPYYPLEKPQDLKWFANIQKGSKQIISGRIEVPEPGKLYLSYGDKKLDSTELVIGVQAFTLGFPVFSEGRSEVQLVWKDKNIGDIKFFARPEEKRKVLILEDYPQTEHRVLAEWLGKRGHDVKLLTPVAKGHTQMTTINKDSEPDFILAYAHHASNVQVRKLVDEGKSVLFLDGKNVGQINQALKTGFQLSRISEGEEIPFKGILTKQPFVIKVKANQKQVKDLPLYYEIRGVKVGVSLWNETFPAQFSGDSLLYEELWSEAWSALSQRDSLLLEGPVFVGDKVDTSFLAKGWNQVPGFGEVFVQDQENYIEKWVRKNEIQHKEVHRTLAPHWKYLLVLLILGLVWIEPKFKY